MKSVAGIEKFGLFLSLMSPRRPLAKLYAVSKPVVSVLLCFGSGNGQIGVKELHAFPHPSLDIHDSMRHAVLHML